MSKQKFRFLIVVHWLLVITYIVVSITTESLLPPELKSYIEAQLTAPITMFDLVFMIFAVVYFIFYVVLYVGLFLFKKWAKALLFPSVALSLLIFLTGEPWVETVWASCFGYLLSLVEGMILALVYFSPSSRVFEVNRHTTR